MFEKFTERSRTVMKLARIHAQRLNSEFIGTEHILLGLLEEGGGVAAKALKAMGVNSTEMSKEIERIVSPLPPAPNPPLVGTIPFSPRAKRVLELSTEEACRAGQDSIGTEHILLGLYMEREGIAFQALDIAGIKAKELRAAIDQILGPKADKKPAPIALPPTGMVTMKVWIFKGGSSDTPNQGKLYYKDDKVDVEKVSSVLVVGIPAEIQESVAAAIAINCGAVAFMIEILKPE